MHNYPHLAFCPYNNQPKVKSTKFYEELTLRFYEKNGLQKEKMDWNHLSEERKTLSLEKTRSWCSLIEYNKL